MKPATATATLFSTAGLLMLACVGCETVPTKPAPADDSKTYSSLEEQLGLACEVSIVRLYRVDHDPQSINRLRRAARSLTAVTDRSQIDYSFAVLDTRVKNAISLPNGRILFTNSLLGMLDDDEVGAVIAHELAHINRRHSLEKFRRQEKTMWQRIFIGGTIGLIPLAGEKLGYLLLDQGYDQQQETEADELGVEYLMRAGKDPEALTRVLEKLERDPDCRKERSFFSTHPSEKTRMALIRKFIGERRAGQSVEPK